MLAHGGRFDGSSWSQQARVLAENGFRVLAIDFRGHGASPAGPGAADSWDGLPLDVLAALRYLRDDGARTVSVVGASMGAWAAAEAAARARPGEIDRLVLISSSSIERPELMQGRKLFITTRGDPWADGSPRLPDVLALYERAPDPKEIVLLGGDAHAQHIFATAQGDTLLREIVRFLSQPSRTGTDPEEVPG